MMRQIRWSRNDLWWSQAGWYPENRMKVAGLTGGIGSGKSMVSGMLAELGAEVIDADQLAREVVQLGNPAWKEIVDHFGKEVLNRDQTLNREKLASIVFADPEARQALEGIVHPRVHALFRQKVRELESKGATVVIYDVPLLFESGLEREIRPVIVVYVTDRVRVERIKQRDGLSNEEVRLRIKSQMPLEEKKRSADYVIDNSGTIEHTRAQVSKIWEKLLQDP